MLFIFSMPLLIRYLWKLKTVVFLNWCTIHDVLRADSDKRTSLLHYSFNYHFKKAYCTGPWTLPKKEKLAKVRLVIKDHHPETINFFNS